MSQFFLVTQHAAYTVVNNTAEIWPELKECAILFCYRRKTSILCQCKNILYVPQRMSKECVGCLYSNCVLQRFVLKIVQILQPIKVQNLKYFMYFFSP